MLHTLFPALFAEKPSLWQQIIDYLYENYGNVTLGGYENFDFSTTASTLTAIIFGLMLGIVIASVFIVVQKNVSGRPVRFLLGSEAETPQSALPLSAIPMKEKSLLRIFRRDLAVKKTVCAVLLAEKESLPPEIPPKTDEEPAAPSDSIHVDCMELPILYHLSKRTDLSKYAFYIPPELQNRAYFRFAKDGNGARWVVFTTVAFFVLSFLLLRFLPQFMKLLDNLVGFIMG